MWKTCLHLRCIALQLFYFSWKWKAVWVSSIIQIIPMTKHLKHNSINLILDLGGSTYLINETKETRFKTHTISVPSHTSLIYVIAYNQSIDHQITINLDGEFSQAQIIGYVHANNDQHINLKTIISHRASHTTGSSFLKGVLLDSSQVTLHGMIQISPQAFDSQDQLTEKLLVLGQDAVGELKPELEILNHDVKASHATTISNIDASQLWYLQSRGLSPQEATLMLIKGFLHDVILRLEELPYSKMIISKLDPNLEISS